MIRPIDQGGVSTFPLVVWVPFQFGQLFQMVMREIAFLRVMARAIQTWAACVGLLLVPAFVLHTQVGIVRMGVKTWLQASCYMFSRLQQKAAPPPLAGAPENMPGGTTFIFAMRQDIAISRLSWPEKECRPCVILWKWAGLRKDVVLPPPMAACLSSGGALHIVVADLDRRVGGNLHSNCWWLYGRWSHHR